MTAKMRPGHVEDEAAEAVECLPMCRPPWEVDQEDQLPSLACRTELVTLTSGLLPSQDWRDFSHRRVSAIFRPDFRHT